MGDFVGNNDDGQRELDSGTSVRAPRVDIPDEDWLTQQGFRRSQSGWTDGIIWVEPRRRVSGPPEGRRDWHACTLTLSGPSGVTTTSDSAQDAVATLRHRLTWP